MQLSEVNIGQWSNRIRTGENELLGHVPCKHLKRLRHGEVCCTSGPNGQ